MNWLQTSAQVTGSMVGHRLGLHLTYPGRSSALNDGPSFLHIWSMVSLHGKSCKGHLQRDCSKISSKIRFFRFATLIRSHAPLLSWTMLQFINQTYVNGF